MDQSTVYLVSIFLLIFSLWRGFRLMWMQSNNENEMTKKVPFILGVLVVCISSIPLGMILAMMIIFMVSIPLVLAGVDAIIFARGMIPFDQDHDFIAYGFLLPIVCGILIQRLVIHLFKRSYFK